MHILKSSQTNQFSRVQPLSMISMRRYSFLTILGFVLVSSQMIGCSKGSDDQKSRVRIDIPKEWSNQTSQKSNAFTANPIPANAKLCFAVNVLAADIPVRPDTATCGPPIGISGGFIEAGQSVTLDVPRGSSRKFEVFIYLADPSSACPAVNQVLGSTTGPFKTFLAGTVSGVNISNPEESVNITAAFPGATNYVYSTYNMATCSGSSAPQLRATLDSSGNMETVSTAGLSVFSQILAYIDSFWSDPGGTLTPVTASNLVTANSLETRPELSSFTLKPDSQMMYALLEGGQIVEVDSTSGAYAAPSTCPFNVTDCTVPAWMQSISAGFGGNLYALDHSGNLYRIDAATPVDLAINVGPTIRQVSYY